MRSASNGRGDMEHSPAKSRCQPAHSLSAPHAAAQSHPVRTPCATRPGTEALGKEDTGRSERVHFATFRKAFYHFAT